MRQLYTRPQRHLSEVRHVWIDYRLLLEHRVTDIPRFLSECVAMSHDYRVKARSDEEVRSLARQMRTFFKTEKRYPVNILTCLRSGSVSTVFGVKKLEFRALPDEEVGGDDARTLVSRDAVVIQAKKSVVDRATLGVGRDRQTLAHELGHAVMHERPMMARATGAIGNNIPGYIKPYESAEHQAKVFAAGFLIIDSLATDFRTAEEISTQFGVSLESAMIFIDQREEDQRRKDSASLVGRMAEEFRNLVTQVSAATSAAE